MTVHLPPPELLVLFNLFAVLRFESRHWWEARAPARADAGGAWRLSGFGFPEWSYLAGTAFFYCYVLWFGWAADLVQAALLFASSWIVGWGYVFLTSWLLGAGTHVLWRPATLAMWPVAMLLAWLTWR
ncbi:MAG: hypothetical protein KatS3mg118_0093 [Paracoccaceae bacterium]|nr:MAG: hypothetical protein KatS3mg118_0093 [Paracoccaceae bacterium]